MTVDIMLDLETLGTGPRAAIVSIGACAFNPHDDVVSGTFFARISLASAMEYGEVEPATIQWWLQQSDPARANTFTGESCLLGDALLKFNAFVRGYNADAVWGNGATFDNVVLRSAFAALSIAPAWSFRADKCYRTVINLVPTDRQPEFVRHGEAHKALDDAITQALHLQKIYKVLGL